MKAILHALTLTLTLILSSGCDNRNTGLRTDEPASVQQHSELQTSELWGESGERWSPKSRLPDFSHAGYMSGEAPIPTLPIITNAKDFGATGDGVTDDTKAIKKALAATENGALYLPEGRYVITERLRIEDRSNLVIRGAGPEKTILVIPKSLEQIEGAKNFTAKGVKKSSFSFGGGFIEFKGGDRGKTVAKVIEPVFRGSTRVTLDTADSIKADDQIRLWMSAHPELADHLFAGQRKMGEGTVGKKYYVDWVTDVEAVESNTLILKQPLRTDIRPEWNPVIRLSRPTLQNCGIEDLGFEFAGVPKRDHLLEEGFNAIHITYGMNCWVRNVRIIDSDLGILLSRSKYCTLEDIYLGQDKRTGLSKKKLKGITGHHGLWVTGFSQDCLIQNFEVDTHFHHDITVEGFSNGNVFRNGKGLTLNFDHHGNAPYENLFTNIDVGNASRIWKSSGRSDRMPHTAARTTFWNIRYNDGVLNYRKNEDQPYPPNWPLMNIVGMQGLPEKLDQLGVWIEPLEDISPVDLFSAQQNKRLDY